MVTIAFARHPDPTLNKPIIDYEACAFMQSGELLGVVFGVLLNLVLPEIVIIIFLAVLLTFNAYKTLAKGVQKYKSETKRMEVTNAAANGETIGVPEKQVSNDVPNFQGVNEVSVVSKASVASFQSEHTEFSKDPDGKEIRVSCVAPAPVTDTPSTANLKVILDSEAVQFPLWAWALLIPMTVYTIIYALIKKFALDICNPVGYWIWYFTPVIVLGGFMVVTGWILNRRYERKVNAGYKFKGDGEEDPAYKELKWDNQTLKKFPTIAVLAGVAAGLLGIGGGMVIGPLFIALDMQPKVGSSSCAFMILFTALSGVVQYSFAGKLGWEFILYGVAVGFISGQLGQYIVDAALKRTGRPSTVIFLLGGIVGAACISMTITGIYKLAACDSSGAFTFDTTDLTCQMIK